MTFIRKTLFFILHWLPGSDQLNLDLGIIINRLAMNNREYAEKLEQEIALHPGIRGKIKVKFLDKKVVLTGVVKTLEERKLAIEIAKKLGIEQLDVAITLESSHSVGDEELLKRVKIAIDREPGLAHQAGVFKVENGVVYLRGHVESAEQANQLIELVQNITGVKEVISEIQLLAEKEFDDIKIANEVEQALHISRKVHAEFITVHAHHGLITLEGFVFSNEEASLAEEIATGVAGVRHVHNRLELISNPTDGDQILERKVMEALEKAEINLVDANISVVDRVVFLDGIVDTYQQKEEAEKITRQMPGIKGVENNLVVSSS
jgi:osmotically-inducible protein OsmY